MEDLVGLTDIAQRLGVAVNTVWRWSRGERREDFPQPVGQISGRPVWQWREVEKWAKHHLPLPTGRPRKPPPVAPTD